MSRLVLPGSSSGRLWVFVVLLVVLGGATARVALTDGPATLLVGVGIWLLAAVAAWSAMRVPEPPAGRPDLRRSAMLRATGRIVLAMVLLFAGIAAVGLAARS